MATIEKRLPSPDELDVLDNVITYASSEFQDVLLDPLKRLSEDDEITMRVDLELQVAGLPQDDPTPKLTEAEVGRLFRTVYGALKVSRWLEETGENALALLDELSDEEVHGHLTPERMAAYRSGMAQWFAEHGAMYERD